MSIDTYENGRRALGVMAGHDVVSRVDPLVIERMWAEMEGPYRALAGSVKLVIDAWEGVAAGIAAALWRVSTPIPYKRNAGKYGR